MNGFGIERFIFQKDNAEERVKEVGGSRFKVEGARKSHKPSTLYQGTD